MVLQFFRPQDPALNPYLEGYYFLDLAPGEQLHYLTFPNNFSIISVLDQAVMSYDTQQLHIRHQSGGPLLSELICHYRKPIRISYEGPVREITFYFKPLGLNAFIDGPLQQYLGPAFSRFIPHEDYVSSMQRLLALTDIQARRQNLEAYWLSHFRGFGHRTLPDIVRQLQQRSNAPLPIQELAQQYGYSRQHLNKLFERHIGKSPVAFRKIQRFRDTLTQQHSDHTKQPSLTALSYEQLFYDQSHLVKDFRALTGLTPGAFFRRVSLQESALVNWLFLQ